MAQVRKYSIGGRARDNARARFEQIYGSSDADTRAVLDGYLQSAQNYAIADPMNNRSSNQYETEVYNNAIRLANGDVSVAPSAGVTTKNLFNGYSRRENKTNADEVLYRYMNKNGGWTVGNGSGSNASTGGKYYTYNWREGWDPEWGMEDEDLDSRLGTIADLLSQNLGSMIQYKNDGYTIKGYRGGLKDIDQLQSVVSRLNRIKSEIGTTDSKELLKQLTQAARQAGMDANDFKDYFGQWLQVSLADKNKKKLLADGWTEGLDLTGNDELQEWLKQNHYNVLTDSNGYNYVFDKDFNQLSNQATMYANADWTNADRYNRGYGVDNNGQLWFGNVDDIKNGHAFYNQFNEYLSGVNGERDALYEATATPWNSMYGNSENDLVNELSEQLNGKKFVDVGKLFDSDQPVLAVPKDGKTIGKDRYGNIKLDNMEFYYQGADGQIYHANNYQQVAAQVGQFNVAGFNEDSSGAADFSDYSDIANMGTDISYDDNYTGRSALGNFFKGNWGDMFTEIQDDPQGWVSEVLDTIAQGSRMNGQDRDFLNRFGYTENPQMLATFLSQIIEEGGLWNSLSSQQKHAYQALLRRVNSNMGYQQQVAMAQMPMQRNGGIVRAATGTTLSLGESSFTGPATATERERALYEKENKHVEDLIEKADEEGRKPDRYTAGQRKLKDGLSTADKLRFATMAQDVAAVLASFTAVGGAAASSLGLTSMGTELAADILDDSVSKGEVIKNALMNTGFAALNWIPGAGLSKVTKNLIKWAPRVMTAVSATGLALDKDVRESWTKIADGKANLTVDDLKNVAHTLSALAGVTNMGRHGYDKIKNRDLFKGKSIGEIKTKSGEKVKLSEEQVKDVNKILSKGGDDAEAKAVKKIAEITKKKSEDFDADLLFKDVKSGIRRKVTGKELDITETKDIDYNKLADTLAAEDAKIKEMAEGNLWQRFLVNRANRFGGGAYTNKANLIRDYVAGRTDVPADLSYVKRFDLNRSGAQDTLGLQKYLRGLANPSTGTEGGGAIRSTNAGLGDKEANPFDLETPIERAQKELEVRAQERAKDIVAEREARTAEAEGDAVKAAETPKPDAETPEAVKSKKAKKVDSIKEATNRAKVEADKIIESIKDQDFYKELNKAEQKRLRTKLKEALRKEYYRKDDSDSIKWRDILQELTNPQTTRDRRDALLKAEQIMVRKGHQLTDSPDAPGYRRFMNDANKHLEDDMDALNAFIEASEGYGGYAKFGGRLLY